MPKGSTLNLWYLNAIISLSSSWYSLWDREYVQGCRNYAFHITTQPQIFGPSVVPFRVLELESFQEMIVFEFKCEYCNKQFFSLYCIIPPILLYFFNDRNYLIFNQSENEKFCQINLRFDENLKFKCKYCNKQLVY